MIYYIKLSLNRIVKLNYKSKDGDSKILFYTKNKPVKYVIGFPLVRRLEIC